MAEIGLRTRMLVKDVMSSPAITVPENTTVDKTAQLMSNDRLGCIIVTNKDGKALGLLRDNDILTGLISSYKTLQKVNWNEDTVDNQIANHLKFAKVSIGSSNKLDILSEFWKRLNIQPEEKRNSPTKQTWLLTPMHPVSI